MDAMATLSVLLLPAKHGMDLWRKRRLSGDFAEAQSRDFKEPIDEEVYAEGYGYSSDSDLEDDEDERAPSPKHPSDPLEGSGQDESVCEHREEGIKRGKVVRIPDIACVT